MGSIISKFRNNHNRLICNNLIEHFTKQITDLNIGINMYIGKNNQIKKYRYKTQKHPKYYIIVNLPYGCTPDFNIINSGSIILNGNDKMALIAFNRFQSISKIYKPLNEFYTILEIRLENNSNLEEAIINIIVHITNLKI